MVERGFHLLSLSIADNTTPYLDTTIETIPRLGNRAAIVSLILFNYECFFAERTNHFTPLSTNGRHHSLYTTREQRITKQRATTTWLER